MTTDKTGGPAFPTLDQLVESHKDGSYTTKPMTGGGITIRDYFASAALTGFLANQKTADWVCNVANNPDEIDRLFAQIAFGIADAMLAKRAKP